MIEPDQKKRISSVKKALSLVNEIEEHIEEETAGKTKIKKEY